MSKTKSTALILGVLVMSFLVGYLVLAWTEPTQTPPGGNVPAPLNISINAQSKEGALVIGNNIGPGTGNPGITTALVVPSGKVGIGTTSPDEKLQISSGNIALDFGHSTNLAVNRYEIAKLSSRYKYLSTNVETPKISILNYNTAGTGWYEVTDRYRAGLSFYTIHQNSQIEAITIQSGGNVGIGTTNPSTKLHVVGGVRITGLVSCNTIDTDANGNFSCGVDETGEGGGLPSGCASNQVTKFDGTNWICANLISIGAGGVSFTNNQTFSSNGTFTVPAGVTKIMIEIWGGGGGGGEAITALTYTGGGGGGGGGYCQTIYNVVPGQNIGITVGSGGSGGTGDGSNGGSSSAVGLTASGGSAGKAGILSGGVSWGEGGAGGICSDASKGKGGGAGGSASGAGGFGGTGGVGGGGGKGGVSGGIGGNGLTPGGGGGGGGAYGGDGGAGAAGRVVVWY